MWEGELKGPGEGKEQERRRKYHATTFGAK